MFVENYVKFLKYYGKGRKKKIIGFFLLSLIAGIMEFLGIALIYPFILLIIKPEYISTSKYYYYFASITKNDSIIINAFILGIIVIVLFMTKNLFMIFNSYLQNKFIANWKMAINKKFMEYYLFSSFKNSLKTAPSAKIYNLTFLANQVIDGFAVRGINLITNLIIVSIILILLFIKFPTATFFTSFFVIITIILQNNFFKKSTKAFSSQFFNVLQKDNNKTIEIVNNIKELKILSAEDIFFEEYNQNQRNLNSAMVKYTFYSSIPPYCVEILILLSLFALVGIIFFQNINNTSGMVASFAVIAAAVFRIAPSLSKIQISINLINSSRDFVKALNNEYENVDFGYTPEKSNIELKFNDNIELIDVNFSYDGLKNAINDLNLKINKGEFVGIIGISGSGKTTLADIIMGLLPIDSGLIKVDAEKISLEKFYSLRKLIGYVPQQINILDASFKDNVTWGQKKEKINDERVIEALKNAQLYEFVSGFKEGINAKAITGSNGLSQGQKQRLAIARALYRDAEILIFDEATSSLDMETEYEITEMLNVLKGQKTIIAIAHRLSTLKTCDKLIYLKNGQVIDVGSFKELSKKHVDFEKLINLSNIDNA